MSVPQPVNPVSDLTEASACLRQRGYEIIDLVGCGHFAACYTARDSRYGNEIFCAKIISLAKEADEDPALTFRAELDTLISLTHPNIITVYAHFSSENYAYLILEYCEKGSIQELVARERGLSYDMLRDYCRQILSAMIYLHGNNFCHRDIKPANILLDKYGRPKLADFGFARQYSAKDSHVCGSTAYMSPELIERRASDPIANDVWALGVTFYEMAYGSTPWVSSRATGVAAEIAAGIVQIPTDSAYNLTSVIRKMLNMDPKKRGTMQDIMKMPMFDGPRLSSFASSGSIPTLRPTSGQASRMSLVKNAGIHCVKQRSLRLISISVPEAD
jgi:serine/threonine protein kinase